MSTKTGGTDHLFLFTYGNCFLIICTFHFNIHYLFVYLFKTMSTKAGGSDHLFLFTYVNPFLITCGFCFNINYLFVYLFKAMSTEAGGSDHLFLFTYGNHLLWDMVFVLIFSIYLFIYSKWCQQKQVELTTFIYLCKSLVVKHGFHLNIHYLFIYLFIQSDVNKSRWNRRPLFTYANHLLWQMVFIWIFSIYLFIYSN